MNSSEESLDAALLAAFVSLVKVLHRRDAMHIDELIAEFGETIDQRRREKADPATYETSLRLYHALEALRQQIV